MLLSDSITILIYSHILNLLYHYYFIIMFAYYNTLLSYYYINLLQSYYNLILSYYEIMISSHNILKLTQAAVRGLGGLKACVGRTGGQSSGIGEPMINYCINKFLMILLFRFMIRSPYSCIIRV